MPIDIFFSTEGWLNQQTQSRQTKKNGDACNILQYRTMQPLIFHDELLNLLRSSGGFFGTQKDPVNRSLPSPCAVRFGCQNARFGVRRYWQDGEDGEPVADLAGQVCKNRLWKMIPSLVNIEKAIENGHRNNGFTH